MFSRIAVIGLGLIGGSVAAAARRAWPDLTVVGVDAVEAACRRALELGVATEAHPADATREDLGDALSGVELVVLATPVAEALRWLDRLHEAGYRGIVTDVCSTKSAIVAKAAALRPAYAFIGGHPMAGSERSGIDAANPELFDGAYYVLTPMADTDAGAFRRVHEFVTGLGARPISIPADVHDEAVALISHVPHVAAAALVALVAEQPAGEDALRLAAGGFKDMTRIAAGSPDLWTGICSENADRIVDGLDRLQDVIARFKDALARRDAGEVRSLLAAAAEVRRSLPARWVPASAALFELSIPMRDRPGAISEITTLVGRAGCNIEDIEIDHVSEDSAVLRLVLTDEGDRDALVESLQRSGHVPTLRRLEEA